uniref:Uncharacterized mobilization operon protein C n=1 Tax=Escherichia coli TaxID=562 RepID=YPMC_ECOLX|nr:RecName: Full=Uncharacterized mobilization operon protein C [Escherichia coli]CAA28522.1 unnamed protein product [Escherichia coli]
MEASITVSHSFQCHPRDALRALCAALLTSAATSRNSLASSTHAAPVWRWAFSHSAACASLACWVWLMTCRASSASVAMLWASGSICSANSLMPLDFFTLSIAFMVYCLPVFL